ncbi:16S rRNA (guanine(966)-N(2))-methyltransferase RsmD [Borreliella valaisiana]|uniref:Putative methyltransferase n=1 Tax=Borreliella valaisiana VS116 TaxID=445987 RepID=D6RX50_BORVA|nr:16S rRNA (guanine(966)-N(2))-methyltransferase RsmD [Borreliella valaisiana]AIJ29575.1 methyltransferase [Borreliella valaisiana Tom4006]EEF81466.1 putative methyltransferase [Borreliella valaisiana VS116]WKC76859.1 16S rRNA (guanine(966)-N(2))-methyltransferase RsmD [Borreliella valaisiana]WLN25022.1 16S rRNA (guanine(966)-N(2))-methyltransferase RsmD [Borreliella valaisiana]WVN13946.1 16S rRNA (guanine(966)-N(2))-methyltransferase RsmD [Borreliella valaisiana]
MFFEIVLKSLFMYVSSGKYKGKKILFPKTCSVRPVMSLVREAFFSIIFKDIVDSKFLDVFAGTGIMSVEALSRGASLAHLVECNRKTRITLMKNFSFVEEFYKFFFQRAEDFLSKKDLFYDFIYLDPPFNYKNKVNLLEIILKGKILNDKVNIIMHCPFSEDLDINTSKFSVYNLKRYGGSKLIFLKIL